MKKEVWKEIIGFENYMVSSLGRIKRTAGYFVRSDGLLRFFRERMCGFTSNKGYCFVHLQTTGNGRKYPVHRIVAQSFIDNCYNKPQVNHKNGNRQDNRIENLEWVTNEENSRHSREVLGKDTGIQNRKRIACIDTGIEYTSAREAGKQLGIRYGNICNVLKGRHKTVGGYKFKYV